MTTDPASIYPDNSKVIHTTRSGLTLRHASSYRGAELGRRNEFPPEEDDPHLLVDQVKLRLEKLRFEDGAYDIGGAYWGSPANLYCAWCDNPRVRIYVRAKSRDSAKTFVETAWASEYRKRSSALYRMPAFYR